MNAPTNASHDALQGLLNPAAKRSWTGHRRVWWLAGITLVAIAAGVLTFSGGGSRAPVQFVTEEATLGNLLVSVSASGTLQPTKSVDVGSELSGTVARVLVQENDRVTKGQLLAQLDTAKLADAVARSRAAVAASEARVAQAQATVAETKATLSRMQQVAALSGGKVPSKTELETAQAAQQRAIANESSARAEVTQARASLKTDETNLAKATIRSPVNGVVLTRKVEPGNTLVAAMNTPVMFVIAEDLTRMELQVKVDEADVASIKSGQSATFTVAAWPGRKFPATIERVSLGSTTTENVVTYKAILKVANADLALRPGMTATAAIVTVQRENALLAPNAALRFTPATAPEPKPGGSFVSNLLPRPPETARRPSAPANGNEPQVWILGDAGAQAVRVKTGASNGRYTEVLGGELKAGTPVITDYREMQK